MTHPIPAVEYRNIPGFPGYRIGDNEKVQTCLKPGKAGCSGRFCDTWRDVRIYIGPRGYRSVRLRRDGRNHSHYLHRLLLEIFVGPCPPGMEACHDPDPDPANNRLDNLSWGTHHKNMLDRDKHGTLCRGSRFPQAKLSEQAIPEIFRMKHGGMSLSAIARHFKVSRNIIWRVTTGKGWKHVKVINIGA